MERERVKIAEQALYSSENTIWETPQGFFDMLDKEFNFTLDPCATAENAKCDTFFTPADDGLKQDWSGHVVFMNPPYGRKIGKWIRKAYTESQKGAIVVALIPARTDTKYWHDFCMRAKEIRLVKGRLTFSGAEHSAPFPSAVVIFKQHGRKYPKLRGVTR